MKLNFRSWRIDLPLLVATAILLAIGLLVLQAVNFKDASLAQDFSASKQLFSAGIGIALLVLLAKADYRIWFRLGKYWYYIGLGLLLLVLIIGKTHLGATRTLDVGFLNFQPTEFIKLGLVFMLSWFFAKYFDQLRHARFILLSLGILAVPMMLVAVQPDLGSAIVLGVIWLVMVFASNASKPQLGIMLAIGLALLPIMATFLHPYQQRRLETFLHPLGDPQGAGYNVAQSQIAVGSGGWLGKGLGGGTQSQLNFLPSQHTDFIFAVTAEKLGFLGAGLVILLFTVILVRAVMVAWRASDAFGFMLATGITGFLAIHVLINIGMNLGIMPVTGIPLPFLSYGGTNLIVSLAAVGLLLSVSRHRQQLEFKS